MSQPSENPRVPATRARTPPLPLEAPSTGHRQLARSVTRLIAEARAACEREGVDPTKTVLRERIGARLRLRSIEVAQGLRLLRDAGLASDASGEATGCDAAAARDPVAPFGAPFGTPFGAPAGDETSPQARVLWLSARILGVREREAILAAHPAGERQRAASGGLAARYGVSPARVRQIEDSARRKVATALLTNADAAAAMIRDALAPIG